MDTFVNTFVPDPSTQQISNISPEHLADCLSSDYPNLGDTSKRPAYLSDDSKRPAYLSKRPEASNKRPYPNSPASKDRDRRYSNGEGKVILGVWGFHSVDLLPFLYNFHHDQSSMPIFKSLYYLFLQDTATSSQSKTHS